MQLFLYLMDRERDLDRLRDLFEVSTLSSLWLLLQFLLGLRDTLLDLYSLSFCGKGEWETDLDLRGEYESSSLTLLCLCLSKSKREIKTLTYWDSPPFPKHIILNQLWINTHRRQTYYKCSSDGFCSLFTLFQFSTWLQTVSLFYLYLLHVSGK